MLGLLASLAVLIGAVPASSLEPGELAPHCALTPVTEGAPGALSVEPGELLLVDFWASWCGSCPRAFVFLNEVQEQLGGRGLWVLAVSVDEDPADTKRFLAEHPAHFSVSGDPVGTCPDAYGVEGMPSLFLIDGEGRVRAIATGSEGEGSRSLIALAETLLADVEIAKRTRVEAGP